MAFSAQSAAADAVGLAERPAADLTDQRVIPLRHPGRWIATIAVLVLAAQFLHGLATNPFYQWGRFGYWFARPLSGEDAQEMLRRGRLGRPQVPTVCGMRQTITRR